MVADRPSVRPSVGRSVRRSARPSVRSFVRSSVASRRARCARAAQNSDWRVAGSPRRSPPPAQSAVPVNTVAYASPIDPSVYPLMATSLLAIGSLFLAWFFMSVAAAILRSTRWLTRRLVVARMRHDVCASNRARRIVRACASNLWRRCFARRHARSYEITTTNSATVRRTKSIAKELILAAVASGFLGFGTLFLLLWCGVYV